MAKAKTTSVAVVTSTELKTKTEELANMIPQLIQEQKDYLKALKGGQEDNTISLDIEYDGTPVSSIEKVSELVELEASLIAREAAYTAVLKSRNLEEKVVEWNKSEKNIQHWRKVLDKAFSKLVNQAEILEVESRIKDLSSVLSEDEKRRSMLENLIKKGVGKLS